MASPKHPSDNSWAERPILVAGKGGQLARCLQDIALQENLPLISLGRPELDLGGGTNIEEIIDRFAPAAVVNASAYTAVDQAEAKPEAARAINCDGAARLAAYSRAVVTRTSWLSSPYGHNFVRTMLRLPTTQSAVRIVNDQRGTPTPVSDLAMAALDIVRQLRADCFGDKSGIYHLVGQGETTWHNFANAIFTSLARRGVKVPRVHLIATEDYPTPANRPRNSCLDSSKAYPTFRVQLAPWQTSLEKCRDRLVAPVGLPAC